jgi:hypothetical protein
MQSSDWRISGRTRSHSGRRKARMIGPKHDFASQSTQSTNWPDYSAVRGDCDEDFSVLRVADSAQVLSVIEILRQSSHQRGVKVSSTA